MIVAVPDAMPVMIPDVPTDAMPEALLLHVPPPVVEDNVADPPTQTLLFPLIVRGPAFTDTVIVDEHPARL